MLDLLIKAGNIALPRNHDSEKRSFLLGAIGIRNDGTEVSSQNGAVVASSYEDYRIVADAHAEARCLKKMDRGGVLYVARVLKKDMSLAISKPCFSCAQKIKACYISKVYYTVSQSSYGIWYVKKDIHRLVEF